MLTKLAIFVNITRSFYQKKLNKKTDVTFFDSQRDVLLLLINNMHIRILIIS